MAAARVIEKPLLTILRWTSPRQILLHRGAAGKREVALTFDDGPHLEGTPKILDVLSSCQIQATFFLVGKHAATHPDLVRRISEDGHMVGNHTQSHSNLTHIGKKEWKDEIEAGERTLERLLGRPISFFRPPYGEFSLSILYAVAKKKKTTVLWSFDPKDFANDQEERLWEKLVESPLRGGEIILLHDWVPATAAVLPRFIELVRKHGLRFTTVKGMLK